MLVITSLCAEPFPSDLLLRMLLELAGLWMVDDSFRQRHAVRTASNIDTL